MSMVKSCQGFSNLKNWYFVGTEKYCLVDVSTDFIHAYSFKDIYKEEEILRKFSESDKNDLFLVFENLNLKQKWNKINVNHINVEYKLTLSKIAMVGN